MEHFWKNDLPERFSSMTIKELRQSLRRASFVYPFLAIQLAAVLAISYEFQAGISVSHTDAAGMLNLWMLWDSGPFWMVVGGICLLIMPLTGLVLMREELEEGNHELLQLTPLNRWSIVGGKFLTSWGLSSLTFLSLLPYVVVRYLAGGVEWWRESACAGTVLGGSAIIAAASIGASAFKGTAARIGMLLLALVSMVGTVFLPLLGSHLITRSCGLHYHITAFCAIACCVVLGLSLARSRLRMSIHAYEVQPSKLIIGWLIFVPFIVGFISGITVGWGGFVGLCIATFVTVKIDMSPKVPKWMPAPPPNIPAPVAGE